MKHDYTMDEFRAEMRRRGVYKEAYPNRWKGSQLTSKPRVPKISAPKKAHGSSIVQIVPCGVHPLHAVKVLASGSRSGCPMCEMQIESLCRSAAGPATRDHAPWITLDCTRIVGCTCGWRTPPGADSDDAYIEHVTVLR